MSNTSYQLVLQFQSESIDFDALVDLEDRLISLLKASADVDGHDFGSGEANIFIITPDPRATFARCRGVVQDNCSALGGHYKAAYRSLHGTEYTVLHPKGLIGFEVL